MERQVKLAWHDQTWKTPRYPSEHGRSIPLAQILAACSEPLIPILPLAVRAAHWVAARERRSGCRGAHADGGYALPGRRDRPGDHSGGGRPSSRIANHRCERETGGRGKKMTASKSRSVSGHRCAASYLPAQRECSESGFKWRYQTGALRQTRSDNAALAGRFRFV